jgi:hypothetical protein
MEDQKRKGLDFVSRLLTNPAIRDLVPLQREEQIKQFLDINARQLQPTLASGAFFPGASWSQIRELLEAVLAEITNKGTMDELDGIVFREIDYTFVSFIRQQNLGGTEINQEIRPIIQELLTRPESRKELTGVFSAIRYRLVDKYVEQLYDRHEYGHFELVKVQRLKMSKEEIKNLVKVTLLLRPAIHLLTTEMDSASVMGPTVQAGFAEKTSEFLHARVKALPREVIHGAVTSNVNFLENGSVDATARIAGILSGMGKTYRPAMHVDRGADKQEKSWINVARKNFRFFGWDIKMLDEFYKIAAENGW